MDKQLTQYNWSYVCLTKDVWPWRGFLLCQYDDNIILISRKDCVNNNERNHYRNQIDVESRD